MNTSNIRFPFLQRREYRFLLFGMIISLLMNVLNKLHITELFTNWPATTPALGSVLAGFIVLDTVLGVYVAHRKFVARSGMKPDSTTFGEKLIIGKCIPYMVIIILGQCAYFGGWGNYIPLALVMGCLSREGWSILEKAAYFGFKPWEYLKIFFKGISKPK